MRGRAPCIQEVTGTMGPNIGTPDAATLIAYNTRLNELGMDPVSLGFTLSMAMELVERGILSAGDLDGLDLRFGNVEATQGDDRAHRACAKARATCWRRARSAPRRGSAAALSATPCRSRAWSWCPSSRAARPISRPASAVASIGPRHDICEHDWDYDVELGWPHAMELTRTLGIYERIPMEHLGLDKVRNYKALNTIWSAADALSFCVFAIAPTRVLSMSMMTDLVAAISGLGDLVPRAHAASASGAITSTASTTTARGWGRPTTRCPTASSTRRFPTVPSRGIAWTATPSAR